MPPAPSRLSGRSLLVAILICVATPGCQQVRNTWFDLTESPLSCDEASEYDEQGTASWYGRAHHGRRTASGARFNMNGSTAAHRTLPFGTKIRVTNQRNGRAVTLVVNDRGPFIPGRILDVSYGAARQLNFVRSGLAPVRVETVESC